MKGREQGPGESAGREDGAVIVEFAAIFVVFAMLLWGLISYGVIFAAQQSLTHAAADAARATVGMSDPDAAEARAIEMLEAELGWLEDGIDAKEATVGPCENAPDHECVSVRVTYDWANHPIVPTILDVAAPTTLTGRAVVEFS